MMAVGEFNYIAGDDPYIANLAFWLEQDRANDGFDEFDLEIGLEVNFSTVANTERAAKLVSEFIQYLLPGEGNPFLFDQTGNLLGTAADEYHIKTELDGPAGFSFYFNHRINSEHLRREDNIFEMLPELDAFKTESPATNHLFKLAKAVRDSGGDTEISVRRQLGPQITAQLNRSVPEVNASRSLLPGDRPVYDGRDVVVGAIDYGCDFVHPNFRRPGGGSRIVAMWDQNTVAGVPPVAPFPGPVLPILPGRVITREEINDALSNDNGPDYVDPDDLPYYHLGYDPHDNYYQDEVIGGAHGTHVLDVACGGGRANIGNEPRGRGIAPEADIVFVQAAKPRKIAGRRVFNPYNVILGTAFIFSVAEHLNRASVVNISLNGMEGPHDGMTPWDRMLDALQASPGRAVVIGAGNFRTEGAHARDEVATGSETRMTWRFPKADGSRNEMEIWYDRPLHQDRYLTITLKAPWGGTTRVLPNMTDVVRQDQDIVGLVQNIIHDPYGVDVNHRERCVILLSLRPPADDCEEPDVTDWEIALEITDAHGEAAETIDDIQFNAWISRDDEGQSYFVNKNADPEQTLGTLACGRNAIVVGAYQGQLESRPACTFTSEGPTRDGRFVPHISAPGRNVQAARSKGFRKRYPNDPESKWRTSGVMPMHGTSVSAPHVTGAVALMLQKDPNQTSRQLRDTLIETARPIRSVDPACEPHWDMCLGYGYLSTAAAICAVDEVNPLGLGPDLADEVLPAVDDDTENSP